VIYCKQFFLEKNMNGSHDPIEEKIKQLGLVLPQRRIQAGNTSPQLPFSYVRVRGNRAIIAGHGPLNPDGTFAPPLGKVGREVTLEQGYHSAKLTALSILASLKLELGNLNRVKYWLKALGMVNSAPGFTEQPKVMHGFSDLILELYGRERGLHARSAVGLAELPFNIPVEIEAEVEIE
jgi:enamine deaminase RidA (YjgF/YER057c/UK114 family)